MSHNHSNTDDNSEYTFSNMEEFDIIKEIGKGVILLCI